jgi:hypothetical protein
MWKGTLCDDDWYEYYLSLGKNNKYLYIGFYIEANTLKENSVEFGVWAYNKATRQAVPLTMQIPNLDETFIRCGNSIIYGSFTLISYSSVSLVSLLEEFGDWLSKFPDKELRDIAVQKFKESIRIDAMRQND